MPFYRFEFEVTEPLDTVVMRLQSATRPPRGFLETLRNSVGASNEPEQPFVGTVGRSSFRIERDIHYRNSFLPRISGSVAPVSRGSRILLTMFIHPLVAVFMLVWLSIAGSFVWEALTKDESSNIYFSITMFVFGVLLTLGGFVPEAVKAKRLLIEVVKKKQCPTTHSSRRAKTARG